MAAHDHGPGASTMPRGAPPQMPGRGPALGPSCAVVGGSADAPPRPHGPASQNTSFTFEPEMLHCDLGSS